MRTSFLVPNHENLVHILEVKLTKVSRPLRLRIPGVSHSQGNRHSCSTIHQNYHWSVPTSLGLQRLLLQVSTISAVTLGIHQFLQIWSWQFALMTSLIKMDTIICSDFVVVKMGVTTSTSLHARAKTRHFNLIDFVLEKPYFIAFPIPTCIWGKGVLARAADRLVINVRASLTPRIQDSNQSSLQHIYLLQHLL